MILRWHRKWLDEIVALLFDTKVRYSNVGKFEVSEDERDMVTFEFVAKSNLMQYYPILALRRYFAITGVGLRLGTGWHLVQRESKHYAECLIICLDLYPHCLWRLRLVATTYRIHRLRRYGSTYMITYLGVVDNLIVGNLMHVCNLIGYVSRIIGIPSNYRSYSLDKNLRSSLAPHQSKLQLEDMFIENCSLSTCLPEIGDVWDIWDLSHEYTPVSKLLLNDNKYSVDHLQDMLSTASKLGYRYTEFNSITYSGSIKILSTGKFLRTDVRDIHTTSFRNPSCGYLQNHAARWNERYFFLIMPCNNDDIESIAKLKLDCLIILTSLTGRAYRWHDNEVENMVMVMPGNRTLIAWFKLDLIPDHYLLKGENLLNRPFTEVNVETSQLTNNPYHRYVSSYRVNKYKKITLRMYDMP